MKSYHLLLALYATLSGMDVYAANLRPLYDAIRQTERGPVGGNIWDVNGVARGPFCIHAAYAADADVPWAECYTVAGSERCMAKYWRRYAPAALARGDWETLARCHNSGPGWRNKTKVTNGYWLRVKSRLR